MSLAVQLDIEQLTALQQLSSPALPIGGFSYSQGLEAAVELGLVSNEAEALEWIADVLDAVMAPCEAPVWCLLFAAWEAAAMQELSHWNQWFRASRETREVRQETEQMGWSLYRLTRDLGWGSEASRQMLEGIRPITLPLVHAHLCSLWRLPVEAGLTAYLYTWIENQVAAAIKSVPLGQVAGQRILIRLRAQLPAMVTAALSRSRAQPPELATFAPHYAIVSSRHETQFSRLFRS